MTWYDAHLKDLVEVLDGTRHVTLELEEPDYSFYSLLVVETVDGFFITTDSGCSCPTPFESHTIHDFTGPITLDEVIEEATSLARVNGGYNRLSESAIEENAKVIRGVFS